MITLDAIWTEQSQAHLYRALLASLSHPGEVVDVGAALDGRRAMIGVLATLADAASTLADPDLLLDDRDRGLLGAIAVDASQAAFVLARGATAPSEERSFNRGELLAPERGATVVLDCTRLGADGLDLTCTGPGIAQATTLVVGGLHPAWLALRERHCARQPLGIDLILCDERRIAGLPRTTRVVLTAQKGK